MLFTFYSPLHVLLNTPFFQISQRDGCPKIVNLGSSKTDLFYERKKYGFKKRWKSEGPQIALLQIFCETVSLLFSFCFVNMFWHCNKAFFFTSVLMQEYIFIIFFTWRSASLKYDYTQWKYHISAIIICRWSTVFMNHSLQIYRPIAHFLGGKCTTITIPICLVRIVYWSNSFIQSANYRMTIGGGQLLLQGVYRPPTCYFYLFWGGPSLS